MGLITTDQLNTSLFQILVEHTSAWPAQKCHGVISSALKKETPLSQTNSRLYMELWHFVLILTAHVDTGLYTQLLAQATKVAAQAYRPTWLTGLL